MKLNTLEKLYLCMENEVPEIHLSEEVIKKHKFRLTECWIFLKN